MTIQEILHKIKNFSLEVIVTIKNEAIKFAKGCYEHIESIGLLTLSSIGATMLLAEIPFYVSLPLWIEAPMVAPVLGVLLVLGLARLAEYRANRRSNKNVSSLENLVIA
jgi:hypothetical protein